MNGLGVAASVPPERVPLSQRHISLTTKAQTDRILAITGIALVIILSVGMIITGHYGYGILFGVTAFLGIFFFIGNEKHLKLLKKEYLEQLKLDIHLINLERCKLAAEKCERAIFTIIGAKEKAIEFRKRAAELAGKDLREMETSREREVQLQMVEIDKKCNFVYKKLLDTILSYENLIVAKTNDLVVIRRRLDVLGASLEAKQKAVFESKIEQLTKEIDSLHKKLLKMQTNLNKYLKEDVDSYPWYFLFRRF